MFRLRAALPLLIFAAALCGCGPSPDPADGGVVDAGTPFFPDSWNQSYVQVRSCRQSGDHDLNRVQIFADPVAAPIYQTRERGFAPGAVILKAEYDFGDNDCTGAIKQFTVMRRDADGGSPATLDWQWQAVDPSRKVTSTNLSRCIGCHTSCGRSPDGFEGTCALP